jgi:O-antigen ligase
LTVGVAGADGATLLVVGLGGLSLVAVSLSRIEVPLALLCLGIGLPSARFEVGGAVVALSEAVVAAALAAYVTRQMLRKEPLIYPHRLHWPVLAVGLVYLVTFVRDPDWVLASYEFGAIKVFYRLALGIAVYFVVASAVRRRDVPTMVGGLLAGVAINVAYGFQQWLTGDTLVGGLREGVGALLDVHYGPYLGFGLAVSGAALLAARPRPLRLTLAALLVAIAVQMIMANSLTAMVSLVLLGSTLLIAFVSVVRGRGVPLLALGVLAIGAGALWSAAYGGPVRGALAGTPLLERATEVLSGEDRSARSRAFHWELARELIGEHPWGMGLDGYRRYYLENIRYEGPGLTSTLFQGERGISAHNMFLDVGLATGWLGIGAVAWLLLAAWMASLRRLREAHSREEHALAWGLFLVVLQFTLMGLVFGNSLHLEYSSFIFFLALGLLAGRVWPGSREAVVEPARGR